MLTKFTEYNRYSISLSSFVFLLVSLTALFYQTVSFDGAFNLQAAVNLYESGKPVLDYGPNIRLQTLLPYQIVNGAFLALLGKNLLAANCASVLFYLFLFLFFLQIARRTHSGYPLICFSILSLAPRFVGTAFAGYGEMPSIVFALWGFYFIVYFEDSRLTQTAGGAILGLALATKWVMLLSLLPLLFLFYLTFKEQKKLPIAVLFSCIFVAFSFHAYQLWFYQLWEQKLIFGAILDQAAPKNHEFINKEISDLSTYLSRVSAFFAMYTQQSVSILGYIKIVLSIVFLYSAFTLYKTEKISTKSKLFLVLAFFQAVYLFWYIFLSSRIWPRRYLNADVVFFAALSLYLAFDLKSKWRTYLNYFLLLSVLAYSLNFIVTNKQKIISNSSILSLERELRSALNLLPESYQAYGYGNWEAPIWSYLSEELFRDLFQVGVIKELELNKTPGFLFFDIGSVFDPRAWNLIEETFQVKIEFAHDLFRIYKIEDFNFSQQESGHFVSLDPYAQSSMYGMPKIVVSEWGAQIITEGRPVRLQINAWLDQEPEGCELLILLKDNDVKYKEVKELRRGENKFLIELKGLYLNSPFRSYVFSRNRLKLGHCSKDVYVNLTQSLRYKIDEADSSDTSI